MDKKTINLTEEFNIRDYDNEDVLRETPCHIIGHQEINTKAGNDLEDAVNEGYSVYYSRDGKKLLVATDEIEEYVVEEGTEVICNGAFCRTAAKKITLPESLKAIGFNAFGGTLLTSIVIPANVTHIATVNPFATCTTLEQLTVLSPHFVVEEGILYSCDHKVMYGAVTQDYPQELVIPDGVEIIANGAFVGRKLTSVYMPDSVRLIGAGAFCGTGIKELRLSHSIHEVTTECFGQCLLKHLDIPDGVERISDSAFEGDTQLTDVHLPGTLKELGCHAFYSCEKLERVSAPKTLTILNADTLENAGLTDAPNGRIIPHFTSHGDELELQLVHELGEAV